MESTDPSQHTILLIDDDESLRSLIAIAIQRVGFQVETASNGEEALAKLQNKEFSLIITDLMMPKTGGFEFLKQLQGQGGGRTPVIVITARLLDRETKEMIKLEGNVVDFLEKPIQMKVMALSLHRFLGTAPVQPAPAPAPRAPEPKESLKPLAGLGAPKDRMILVVDDEESVRNVLRQFLLKDGFQIETAVDGKDALDKIEKRAPDLIVLDYMMPGTSGYEVLQQLQASEARGVPVVMITGRQLDNKSMSLLRHEPNVQEIIEKPIMMAPFMSLLHKLLNTQPPPNKKQAPDHWGR